MVNKKRIAHYYISLSILSFFIPNALAQTNGDSGCPIEKLKHSDDNNLRRQLNDNTILIAAKPDAKIATISLKQLNVFNTELEAENNALLKIKFLLFIFFFYNLVIK